MFESLFIYILLFIIMFSCGYISSRRVRRYVGGSGIYREISFLKMPEVFVLIFAFTIVFGCRWGVGVDYFRYLDDYIVYVPYRFEYLFRKIALFLQRYNAHFSVYFGVWALLDITLLYNAARRYSFIFPYLAFFLIFGSYYLPMMNAIRQHIAALIFLNSVQYIDQKQILKFGICFFLAMLFHKLSIVLFIFYPLLRWRDDWFKSIPLQLALYAVAVFLSRHGSLIIKWVETPFEWVTSAFGFGRYGYEALTMDKFNRDKFGSNSGLGMIVDIVRTVPIILMSKRLKRYYNSSLFNMFYSLFFLYVLSLLIFGSSVILNRFSYFFSGFHLIVLCMFVYYCFRIKDKTHQILGLIFILMYIPLFLNMISNPNSTAQFSFFWQHSLFE